METRKLHEGEDRFMDLIWRMEPVNPTVLAKAALAELGWKKSTSYTVLRKLKDRGFVGGEGAVVQSLISRSQVQQEESREIVEKSFGGSLPAFVTAFLKDRKLSKEEAQELRRMIEEASE